MDVRLKHAACLASLACMAALVWMTPLAAQEEPAAKLAKRYGYMFEAGLYPQQTPQEALQSIVKALDTKKIDYLLAHLADPRFVDDRIEEYKALQKGSEEAKTVLAFERLSRETTQHFQEDPLLVKELRLYLKDAEWDVQEATAIGSLKTASPHRVFFRKLEDRWFLQNKQQ